MGKKNVIWRYLRKYLWSYIFGILTLFVVDLLNLYIPQFTGEITDGLTQGSMGMAEIITVVVKIAIVGVCLAIGRFLWRYFIFGTCRKIERDIRNDMFRHLTGLSSNYYNENKTGDLMAHFTNDLNAVRMAVGPGVITTFDASIMTIMVFVKMITYVDLRLTLLAIIPLVFIGFGGYYYGLAIERRFDAKQKAFSDLTDQVQENISGIRVIKAFVQERKEIKDFAKANQNNMDKNMSVVKLQAVVMPLLDVIVGLSIVITLVVGGGMVIRKEISLGQFVAFNQYINMLVWPMIATGDCITFMSQGAASAKRITKIFEEQSEIRDEAGSTPLKEPKGKIELNHLSFRYPNSTESVLEDISVTVRPGETLAILGRTGSGKTTIANLLVRLYNTEPGAIQIDDRPIENITLNSLRENIAYVCQDNFLFSDTLANNIAFGTQGCEREKVVESAKQACIHDNIIEFPMGYDTLVGERGVTISGGQKQRTSIARSLMKNAPILILDDALSAVDTSTEETILAHLKANRCEKTTIIIAHRISTIANADHILVLEDGHAAEYGTHESLMAQDGIYADMYQKQRLEKQLEKEQVEL